MVMSFLSQLCYKSLVYITRVATAVPIPDICVGEYSIANLWATCKNICVQFNFSVADRFTSYLNEENILLFIGSNIVQMF